VSGGQLGQPRAGDPRGAPPSRPAPTRRGREATARRGSRRHRRVGAVGRARGASAMSGHEARGRPRAPRRAPVEPAPTSFEAERPRAWCKRAPAREVRSVTAIARVVLTARAPRLRNCSTARAASEGLRPARRAQKSAIPRRSRFDLSPARKLESSGRGPAGRGEVRAGVEARSSRGIRASPRSTRLLRRASLSSEGASRLALGAPPRFRVWSWVSVAWAVVGDRWRCAPCGGD